MHAKKSLLSTFQRFMQANRKINLWEEKCPFTGYPAAKHPKHSKFELFLLFNLGVNFANAGSFAKVSVPVHIYNSLVQALFSQ